MAKTCMLQPTLFAMYFLNYIDRNTLAQARLNGLEEDLGMHGSQFNTTISILFVGYVLTQVPSNMLITRIAPSIYMSTWMVLWSAVSGMLLTVLRGPLFSMLTFDLACTALVKNYQGMVACRFLLGITEAPVGPLLQMALFKSPNLLPFSSIQEPHTCCPFSILERVGVIPTSSSLIHEDKK